MKRRRQPAPKSVTKKSVVSDFGFKETEGDFEDGLFTGYGVYVFQNGDKYEGQFVKGHFHGEGKLLYPNVNNLIDAGRLLQGKVGRGKNDFRGVLLQG